MICLHMMVYYFLFLHGMNTTLMQNFPLPWGEDNFTHVQDIYFHDCIKLAIANKNKTFAESGIVQIRVRYIDF